MKFWKLLVDAQFTGKPSQLSEDEVRQMANTMGLFEPQTEAVIRGFREMLENGKKDGA
jgi:hypothetical protein